MRDSPTSQRPDDAVERYLRRVASDKRQTPTVAGSKFRRATGLWLGAVLGLVYGLLLQSVNSLVIAGVPFAHLPFGFLGNVSVYILTGALIGTATAWPEGGINGVVLGALLSTVLLGIYAWLANSLDVFAVTIDATWSVASNLFGLALAFLVSLVVLLAVRWAVDVQGEQRGRPVTSWPRWRAFLAVIIAASIAGASALYPTPVRNALIKMNGIIKQGLAASAPDALPVVLQSSNVKQFLARANGNYTLEWNDRLEAVFTEKEHQEADLSSPTVIAVRFEGSYFLVCAFDRDGKASICKDFWIQVSAQQARNVAPVGTA